MKVKEEFLYGEIKKFLDDTITLVIANPSPEERKNCIYEEYLEKKYLISIRYTQNQFILCNPSDRVSTNKMATFDTLGKVLISFPNINVKKFS